MKKITLLFVVCISLFSVSCGKKITGEFQCKGGFASSLEFRDGKNVAVKLGKLVFPTTYRYEGDYIYIKHDKGGEFSYKVVNSNTLIGEDMWNQNAKCIKK